MALYHLAHMLAHLLGDVRPAEKKPAKLAGQSTARSGWRELGRRGFHTCGRLPRRSGNIAHFGSSLHVTNPKFASPVAHQVTQVDNFKASDLMHPDKQCGAYMHPPVAYFANDGWRDSERARQRRVIF